jgi:anti-sigma regulatory factor (Ser/Thr protein kinase)/PAS domain-containing protein
MASAPKEPRAVSGRLDKKGRLIAADPELEALQREAGSSLGKELALPQVGAVAQLARKLGTAVSRPAIAASADSDIELWVNATPEGDEVLLSLEGWKVRPAAGPRLGNLLGGAAAAGEDSAAEHEWTADEELRVISLSGELADLLGVDVGEAAGQPLTRLVKLEEDEAGDLPLVSAIAARRGFSGQPAHSRDGKRSFRIAGEVVTGADGSFAGFRGTVQATDPSPVPAGRSEAFDHALDEVLRSPLDRIIETAELIVERADGPLRSDYASYGNDIAAAAKHLLSVLRGMSDEVATDRRVVDLTALAAEAVVMLESAAEERKIAIDLGAADALPATGQEPAVIQILVNLLGNAIRHSPEGSTVKLAFGRTQESASVTVSDQGAGIASADQQRIFERFERAHDSEAGTGLGLAISRRLARSMGGDVTLESAPGEGAHFTLTLPAA